jgi:lysophospholipase L1-like esterase
MRLTRELFKTQEELMSIRTVREIIKTGPDLDDYDILSNRADTAGSGGGEDPGGGGDEPGGGYDYTGKKLYVLGDSWPLGNGLSKAYAYPHLVAQALSMDDGTNQAYNIAVSGSRLAVFTEYEGKITDSDVISKQAMDVAPSEGSSFDGVILVAGGGNDLIDDDPGKLVGSVLGHSALYSSSSTARTTFDTTLQTLFDSAAMKQNAQLGIGTTSNPTQTIDGNSYVSTVVGGMWFVIGNLASRFPDAKIISLAAYTDALLPFRGLSPYPPGQDGYVTAWGEVKSRWGGNVRIVDIRTALGWTADNIAGKLQSDQLHPTAASHQEIATALLSALDDIVW